MSILTNMATRVAKQIEKGIFYSSCKKAAKSCTKYKIEPCYGLRSSMDENKILFRDDVIGVNTKVVPVARFNEDEYVKENVVVIKNIYIDIDMIQRINPLIDPYQLMESTESFIEENIINASAHINDVNLQNDYILMVKSL